MTQPDCPKTRTILVAIDESQHSFYALKWALNTLIVRNDLTHDKIVLLHAKLPATSGVAVGGTEGYVMSADLIARIDDAQDEAIAEFMNRALQICQEKQIAAETIVQWGDPRNVICDTVEKVKADFLVTGSRGHGPIKRVFLGSVSDYCAHNAKCPVVIVRKPDKNSEAVEDDHQHTG